MILLTRTVRFCINQDTDAPWGDADNSYAAYPSMRGLGRFYEMDITCRGHVDPTTGYFLNIKAIDQAVRQAAIPVIARACAADPAANPAHVLAAALPALNTALNSTLSRARWNLSPYYSVEMDPSAPDIVLLRQNFDFAASHRLHSPSLSDSKNRELFGKCNNPRGHGHNYRIEPCVEVRASKDRPSPFGLPELERITARTIIDRFDHKHLNSDTTEFAAPDGLMPSVENIATVCYRLLAPEIQRAAPNARLRSVTVWETDKTSATYPA